MRPLPSTSRCLPQTLSSSRLISAASGTLHACTMSAVAVSTTVTTPRAPATNACAPERENTACPGAVCAASPALGMRHTRLGTSMSPGIVGSGALRRPRVSANVIRPASLGAASASDALVGEKRASCSGASNVARNTVSLSRASHTDTEPSAHEAMSRAPSADQCTPGPRHHRRGARRGPRAARTRTAGEASRRLPAARASRARAPPRVSKSQISTTPAAVPAASNVPRRLNATHVARPRCSDSSSTSSACASEASEAPPTPPGLVDASVIFFGSWRFGQRNERRVGRRSAERGAPGECQGEGERVETRRWRARDASRRPTSGGGGCRGKARDARRTSRGCGKATIGGFEG